MNDYITDEEFLLTLRACPIYLSKVAHELGVDRPTIERWLMGRGLPSQAIREALAEYVASFGES